MLVRYGRFVTAVRVGVLLDTVLVPAWAAWILGEIVANVGLKLALAVIRDDAGNRRRPSLFSLYEMLDRQVFPARPNALALVDVSGLLAGVPRARDPGEIRRHGLDVLLALGSERPEASLLGTARHGVWAYRYGDPPLFEPVFDAAPVTETALELHDPRGTAVIYRSTGTTDVVSLNRNRVPILWKSARFAIRRLDGLASGTWEPPGERGPPPPRLRRRPPAPPRTPPSCSGTPAGWWGGSPAASCATRRSSTSGFSAPAAVRPTGSRATMPPRGTR